jgi:CelD/BcsL family acetyltransferase involved in cellulose biosynthesis
MTRWQVKRIARSLGDHAAPWDALNRHLFAAHPMLESGFVNAMLRHFGDGSEWLCVLEGSEGPVAMCLLQRRGVGMWTTFLPTQAQIGPLLIAGPDPVRALMRALPGYVAALDLLCVDPLFSRFNGAGDAEPIGTRHALTMNVSLDGNVDDYWAGRTRLRQNLRRYERRLADDGMSMRHVCITDPDEMPQAVARYAELESSGWKAPLGTALAPGNAQGAFYTEVMKRQAATGSASVHELWVGERLAASRLFVASGRMLVALKTTYDETLDKYAPGRQLLRLAIEHLFKSHPGHVIEFYTDANQDQLAWATGQRAIQHWTFYRHPSVSAVMMLGRAARLSLSSPRAVHRSAVSSSLVEVYRHPKEVPADVQRLFDQAEKNSVEFGLAWYGTLVDAVYPNHAGVRFFVLRLNGVPVAGIPVLLNRRGLGQETLALGNYYTALYSPVIKAGLKPSDVLPLVTAVRDAGRRSSLLTFAPMDPDSEGYAALWSAFQFAGLMPFRFFCFGNWYLRCAGLSWPAYLASRNSGLRNTIKRMSKKFVADGGTFEIVMTPDRLADGVAAFQHVYAASWKQAEPYPDFVPGLIETCLRRGWLRLGVGRLNGLPVAAQLWIVSHGRAEIYKVAYDEAFKHYSPGTLLTAHLMQHVLEQDRVSEVDYLIGDDRYKETWMDHRRERWGLIAYNPKTFGGLLGLARELTGRAAKPWVARVKSLVAPRRTKEG